MTAFIENVTIVRATKPTALDAFMSRKAEIDDLLEALRSCSDEHFNRNPDTLNWGDVGDLTHIRDVLRTIVGEPK